MKLASQRVLRVCSRVSNAENERAGSAPKRWLWRSEVVGARGAELRGWGRSDRDAGVVYELQRGTRAIGTVELLAAVGGLQWSKSDRRLTMPRERWEVDGVGEQARNVVLGRGA